MDFDKFIVEEGILGISIGTILAFGITNIVKSFKSDIITPYIINHFKINKNYGSFTSSIIEFIILILFLLIVYNFIVLPLFKKHIERNKINKEKEIIWKNKLLSEVDKIERKVIGTI